MSEKQHADWSDEDPSITDVEITFIIKRVGSLMWLDHLTLEQWKRLYSIQLPLNQAAFQRGEIDRE